MAFINNADRAYLKKIQLLTKKRLHATLHGPQISTLRGYGLEFDQLRPYESGDDMRFVDWKASARCTEGLMIKQYLHDYTKNIVIALDCSASMNYRSTDRSLFECAQRLAIIIGCVAQHTKSRLSIILFDNKVIDYISPGQSNKFEILSNLQPGSQPSNFQSALRSMMRYPIKNSLLLMLSDFIDCNTLKSAKTLAKYTEIVALRINDVLLCSFDHTFSLRMADHETNDTHNVSYPINTLLKQRFDEQNKLFRHCGISYKDFFCNASSYKELTDMLVTFFNKNAQLYC